jgi:hypothetical protein
MDGPLRPVAEEAIRDRNFSERFGLDPAALASVADDHYERGGPGKPLWMLFCLSLWWERTRSDLGVPA